MFRCKPPRLAMFRRTPSRLIGKVVDVSSVIPVIARGSTISVSGFVSYGVPEYLLRALAEHYQKTGTPKDLFLFFGAGPGPSTRAPYGLNHFAHPGMLRRMIGTHYGQVPLLGELAQNDVIPAWNLPLGCVSRMHRAQAMRQPFFISQVGTGTFVDPDLQGGAVNQKALDDPYPHVRSIEMRGVRHLLYPTIPIDVAFIRGTFADASGNITFENEPVIADALTIASATKASGGQVVVQVAGVAAAGTISPSKIVIPAALVDAVVVAPAADQVPSPWRPYFDPALVRRLVPAAVSLGASVASAGVGANAGTGTDRTATADADMDDGMMPMSVRKVIGRRALMEVNPNTVINLGIGVPEAIASVASEEGVLSMITLTVESGLMGGRPEGGHLFGGGVGYDFKTSMAGMFDFFNGGNLNAAYLGVAEVDATGSVNVSRVGPSLKGPGGFIDLCHSTRRLVFCTPFFSGHTAARIVPNADGTGGRLDCSAEGQTPEEGKPVKVPRCKFVPKVREVTMSGPYVHKSGHVVTYITERAVFELGAEGLVLMEVAPGVDIDRDVLAHIPFKVALREGGVRVFDERLLGSQRLHIKEHLFSSDPRDLPTVLGSRSSFARGSARLFIDLSGIAVDTAEAMSAFERTIEQLYQRAVKANNGATVHGVLLFDDFALAPRLDVRFRALLDRLQKYQSSVTRFTTKAFLRTRIHDLFGRTGSVTLCADMFERTSWDREFTGRIPVSLIVERLVTRLCLAPNEETVRRVLAPYISPTTDSFRTKEFAHLINYMDGLLSHAQRRSFGAMWSASGHTADAQSDANEAGWFADDQS
eukprot:TRINITY_DN47715_c0_g1_i1.p1 TRINITY_DN47715_c0_g1~~TRINITY_DN47715_c0_g1_i1.p1  ORF type:complete len:818 (+),score=223.17 TRINITY_DN47715_c0_g1_i1:201-2654(+)